MSALPPDPYKTLGVSKDAQLPEIRSAHRKLVLKCHPDKVQDPTLKAQKQDEFQNVQQAYELLSDEKERQRYDDQVRLHELRDQLRAKTSASSARSSPSYKYETRPSERTASYKTPTTPTTPKSYYSRSWEDDAERARNIFEDARPKKESSYTEKSSKRSKDKDREYTRERSDRDRDRDRERDREYREYRETRERESRERDEERERARRKAEKAEEATRRAEKEAKEARKADKRAREKERDKEKKRDTEEKKRHAKPFIEPFDDEPSYKEKKKSSKKHDEKRERSSHREEVPPTTTSMPPPPMPQVYGGGNNMEGTLDSAISYIQASRSKPMPLHRAATYHARHVQPPAPTPPPVPGQTSVFGSPDDDARRSSAKPRRGSSGDKAYKKPSKEVLEDPVVADISPSTRLHKTASASAATGSPPRREVPRTNTMPVEGYPRPTPNIARAQTFSGAYPEGSDPRGRSRSKLQSQIPEDYDSDEEEYERYRRERERDRKHRSKKHRSPDRNAEHVMQYKVSEGRTTLQTSYSREPQMETYGYYPSNTHGVHVVENRPSMPPREGSYSRSGSYSAKYPKFKTSKAYNFDDVSYSAYPVEGVY